jgi:uncharacterized membrane protein
MYDVILPLHSVIRWIVVVAALLTVARGIRGWLGQKAWTSQDTRLGLIFTIVFDVQVLLGIILVFVSPSVRIGFADFGSAMGDPELRYWLVEHIPLMLVALALAHVGRSLTRKGTEPGPKHRAATIWFGLAILVVLVAIPWPFLAYGRPLVPGL